MSHERVASGRAVTDCLTARPKGPKVVSIDDPATSALPGHSRF